MRKHQISEKQLRYMEFLQHDNQCRHHRYDEDMHQYELLRVGDMNAIKESQKLFSSDLPGHISDNPVRNYKYLFVAATTLATRYAIQGGVDEELAYNISDLYILKMDSCKTVDEVKLLHTDMITYFTRQVATTDKNRVYSKPIVQSIEYIYYHLNESVRVIDLANYVNLNSSYLSTLFKKETGHTISDYILSKRIEAAKNMLKYSDYTYSEISSSLAFSTQSYFTKKFKEQTGLTPKVYRQNFFRN